MVTYPIHVPRKKYTGGKANLRQKVNEYNEIADELEKYINTRIQKQKDEYHSYSYFDIAHETGYDIRIITE